MSYHLSPTTLACPSPTILTPGTVELFLRSGISALLGLLALPSMGLAGATPFPPAALPPGFREGTPSSLRSPSAVLVWLLFGYATTEGIAGPAKIQSSLFKSQNIVLCFIPWKWTLYKMTQDFYSSKRIQDSKNLLRCFPFMYNVFPMQWIQFYFIFLNYLTPF